MSSDRLGSDVPAVRLRDVWLSYGSTSVLEALEMDLPDGEFLGLIGPNGGGKTALLRVLTGLVRPNRGRVEVFGRPPDETSGLIGYVPQQAGFDLDFPISVRDVVLTGRLGSSRMLRHWSAEDRRRADAALDRMEIQDLRQRRIGELSGGQLQRVLIARALAGDTRILLLDEPTASLDTRIGAEFYDKLRELATEMTVVLVSHDISVLNRYVSVIACLNRRLHYHGTKEVTREMIEATYGCPVDFLVHAHSHIVVDQHGGIISGSPGVADPAATNRGPMSPDATGPSPPTSGTRPDATDPGSSKSGSSASPTTNPDPTNPDAARPGRPPEGRDG